MGSMRRIRSSASVSDEGAERENPSTWAHAASSHSLQHGRVGRRADRLSGVLEQGARADDVAQPHRDAREHDPHLREVPRREVGETAEERRGVGGVALHGLEPPRRRVRDRGGGEHEAGGRQLDEAEALDLGARPRGEVGGAHAVAAVERQQGELGEAQRADARRRHDATATALLERTPCAVAVAEQVARRSLELAGEGAPGAVVGRQRVRASGVVAHLRDPVAGDRRLHRRDAGLNAGRPARPARRRVGPVLGEIALSAGQVTVRRPPARATGSRRAGGR